MMSRTQAFRVVGPLAIAAGLGAILAPARTRPQVGAEAQPQPEQPSANRATTGRDAADASRLGQSADEPAIRAVDEAFVRGYNQGDSKALAALFTEDAEAVEAEGDRFQGRDRIEGRFAETFAASPGVKITLE